MFSHCFYDLWSTFIVVKHKLIHQVDQQLKLKSIGPNTYVIIGIDPKWQTTIMVFWIIQRYAVILYRH